MERLEGALEVVDGRGRRGEVEDGVDAPREVERVADVRLDEVEARLPGDVREVALRAGDQVVHARDPPALAEGAVHEVAARG